MFGYSMTTFLFFFFACFSVSFVDATTNTLPTSVAVMFYASEGTYAWPFQFDFMTNTWSERLKNKLATDPNWPVNATVELIDYKSNETYMKVWTTKRLADTSLPPVSVFIFGSMGYVQQPWFEKFKIPCILIAMNANQGRLDVGLGPGFNYTFAMRPLPQYFLRDIADKYVELGVKSIVAIANLEDKYVSASGTWSYNYDACINGAHNLFAPRGIEVLDTITYYSFAMTNDNYADVVKRLMDLNPDAVLYCDSIQNYLIERFDTYIVKVMKEMDYMPKSFFQVELEASPLVLAYSNTGLFDYMVTSLCFHPKLTGIDYTENSAPYSGQFRSSTPIKTVAQDLIAGSNLDNYPSSSKVFYDWFKGIMGYHPSDTIPMTWAAFELVEQAMWKASQVVSIAADGAVDGNEMYAFLTEAQAATPYGRIAFDSNRINTKSRAVVAQLYNHEDNPEIVAPSYLATHEFVYPMPTWKERYYEWSLMKGQVSSAIAVAAACSALLIAMMITLTIFRNERDIKMLYYPHLMILMMMVLTILWALVFVWQGDVNQAQCDSLLWTIFLPASFVIQLVNMKAYRLSVFLTSENKKRLQKYTHHYVMKLTLGWVAFTAILLLAAQLADPPTKRTVVLDKYRPSQDYNVCSHGDTTNGILFFLFAQHLFMAICCVAVVRNGMEGFKDGMIMKEAFTILFACIAVAFVMDLLGLDHQTNYFMRTAFVGIGFTLYAARLLMSRCARHWVTQSMALVILKYYRIYQSIMPQSVAPESKVSALEMLSDNASRGEASNVASEMVVYDEADVADMDEMMRALQDESRVPLFRQMAEKGLLAENVDFLLALNALPKTCTAAVSSSSIGAVQVIKTSVLEIFNKYINSGSEKEVNVSHSTRKNIMKKLETWPIDKPMISLGRAEEIVEEDTLHITDVFKNAQKEIRQMLYQNMWNKFRTAETEANMA